MTSLLPRTELPSAIEGFERLLTDGRRPVVFLDYDGVLSPIVSHPDLAVLDPATRTSVDRLARTTDVAVISGRDTADVRAKVGLDDVWYAGSHGFDIVGPDGATPDDVDLERFQPYVPVIADAADRLTHRLDDIDGVHVERKRFAVAVHFREAPDGADRIVEEAVRTVGADHDELRVTTGKKIFELRPAVEWDKGRALRWLMTRLDIHTDRSVPFYLGDDVTDEDAFAAIETNGIGIVVGRDGPPTRATFALEDTGEVKDLLDRLAAAIEP